MRKLGCNTVCEEAAWNIGECWTHKLRDGDDPGSVCTRACAFCNVATGGRTNSTRASRRMSPRCAELKFNHIVITSVDRDDLEDGGAAHFAEHTHPRRDAGDDHRSADAGFPEEAWRHRNRGRGPGGPTSTTTTETVPRLLPHGAAWPATSSPCGCCSG